MCRPLGYQGFVFADGRFVGTLAPSPMSARTDGAMVDANLTGPNQLNATFVRYDPSDPLCCPSHPSAHVIYRIQQTDAGPVVEAVERL
jgi:hypothetical protein